MKFTEESTATVFVAIDTNRDPHPIEQVYRKLNVFEFDDNPEESLKKWIE